MPRVQVKSPLGAQRIVPQAQPVGRFAPAPVNELQQLAGALSSLEPTVGRLAAQEIQRENEQNLAEGQREAQRIMEEEQLTYREAVKEGLIRKDQNPWFRLGMKQQFGEVAAQDYGLALRTHKQNLILAGEDDPSIWDQEEATFRTQWVEQNIGSENRDAAFDQTFADSANQIAYGIGMEFAQAAGSNAEQAVIDRTFQQTMGALRAFEEPDADLSLIRENITSIQDMLINQMGVSGAVVNRQVVAAVAAYAIETEDYGVLELLDPESGLRGGTGALGNTAYAVEALDAARRQITQRREAAWVREDNARKRAIQQQRIDAVNLMLEEYNTNGVISQTTANRMAAQFEAQSPETASYIRRLPANIASEGLYSNPGLTDQLADGILTGTTSMETIIAAVSNQRISSNEGFGLLGRLSQVEAYKAAKVGTGGKAFDILTDPWYTERESSFRRLSGATDNIMQRYQEPDEQRAVVTRYTDAVSWVSQEAMQYQMSPEGQAATPAQQRDYINKLFDQATEIWYPGGIDPADAERLPFPTFSPEEAAEVRRRIEAVEPLTYRQNAILREMGYDPSSSVDLIRFLDTSNP